MKGLLLTTRVSDDDVPKVKKAMRKQGWKLHSTGAFKQKDPLQEGTILIFTSKGGK